jgi:hypothetical protein
MCKNKKLKKALQSLSQITYTLYKEELYLNDVLENNTLMYIPLNNFDPKVIEIPEFSVCRDLMIKDIKMEALQGKLVGTYYQKIMVQNEESCILSFLKQLYHKSKEYDQGIFDEFYLSFENFFYSDYLAFSDSANLYNFTFDNSELELGQGVIIKKSINTTDQQNDLFNIRLMPYSVLSTSAFMIYREYEGKKIIGESAAEGKGETTNELSDTTHLFDLVVNSLRILKSSAVYRDHKIITECITFQPYWGTTIRAPFFENIAVGEKCNLSSTEVSTLRNIFNYLCNSNDTRFDTAQRRLSSSVEREHLEDRLIDNMIGLEALYLPDGNAELSFRLSLRVAFLLSSGADKKDIFYFLKNMYDTRSKIVHGNKYSLKTEDMNQLEELLRKSVILWIEDKNTFSEEQLTKILF